MIEHRFEIVNGVWAFDDVTDDIKCELRDEINLTEEFDDSSDIEIDIDIDKRTLTCTYNENDISDNDERNGMIRVSAWRCQKFVVENADVTNSYDPIIHIRYTFIRKQDLF